MANPLFFLALDARDRGLIRSAENIFDSHPDADPDIEANGKRAEHAGERAQEVKKRWAFIHYMFRNGKQEIEEKMKASTSTTGGANSPSPGAASTARYQPTLGSTVPRWPRQEKADQIPPRSQGASTTTMWTWG
ncbi:MAG: hypothetical protein Q9220_006293 [cf. Caloplaca sp. 1 TL-2023]